MIIKKSLTNYKDNTKVLFICGTHGDETKAIKLCWDFYRKKSFDCEVRYLFLANENAVKNNDRCYIENDDENFNLNRAFENKEESFDSIVEKIKKEIESYSPDVVIDVHDSPSCNNVVLVDFDGHSNFIYKACQKNGVNCMVRPSQNFGTVKRFCIDKGIPAFTVEIAPMFNEYEKGFDEEFAFIKNVIKAGLCLKEIENYDYHPVNVNLLSKFIYCPYKSAIVKWNSFPYGVYYKGDLICEVIDIEKEYSFNIIASEDLRIQDVCCPDVAFEGQPILEYSPYIIEESAYK